MRAGKLFSLQSLWHMICSCMDMIEDANLIDMAKSIGSMVSCSPSCFFV